MANENANPKTETAEGAVHIVPEYTVVSEYPMRESDVLPLNYEKAFASYSEEEQKEIVALSESIDVREIEKVMSYGAVPLRTTFDQCGAFLKTEKGSEADQRVIEQVVELSKKASESYDDFNLVLKTPSLLQKFFIKLFNPKDKDRTEAIQKSAVTCYTLLGKLRTSCEEWLEMLKGAMGEIEYSAMSDSENITLLEKYLIAGHMASKRIEASLADIEAKYQETGLLVYSQESEKISKGLRTFNTVFKNLEKSRAMYYLSIAQLTLIEKSNINVQLSIHTQLENSMALIGQQLRNAVLNAKTREVLEGQQAIKRLNDELIKEISSSVGKTAEETERLIYDGFYNIEAAKEAVTTVITSCQNIEKTASEMLPKMKADMTVLDKLISELAPCVESAEKQLSSPDTTPKISGGKGLQF